MSNLKDMDQESAKRLFFEGATFLLLGVPEGTEFGIDMKVWNTEENFRGIKMIPPGLHFIHYSATNSFGDTGPRAGFFYTFRKSEFIVKMWDKKMEDISETEVDSAQIAKLRDNLLTLDKFLGPYPYDIHDKWKLLTSHISENLAKELSPLSQQIRSALVLIPCDDANRPRGSTSSTSAISDQAQCSTSSSSCTTPETKRRRRNSKVDGEELLPDLKPVPGTELRFTKFPENNYPDGATPAEITQHSLDSSYVLETMLKRYNNVTDIIGEIQFSFICFLVGHSLEAFEHWKNLVGLVCSCEKAITKYRIIYDLLAPMLEMQLKEIPEEFLADIVSNNNFIYCKLRSLFRFVQDSSVDGRLKSKMNRFKDILTETYQWDFGHLDSEEEEDAPVVVEL